MIVVKPEKCGEFKSTLESGMMNVSVPICGKPKPSVTWTIQDVAEPVVESSNNDLPWNFTYTTSFRLLACQEKNVNYKADGYGNAIEGKASVKADCKFSFVMSSVKSIMVSIHVSYDTFFL